MGTHNTVVYISNALSTQDLFLNNCKNNHGTWATQPPGIIKAGAMANFELDTQLDSAYGADGIAIYAVGSASGQTLIEFKFACPTTGKNEASAIVSPPSAPVQVVTEGGKGSPLIARFTVSDN
jgi:hypothetical protein